MSECQGDRVGGLDGNASVVRVLCWFQGDRVSWCQGDKVGGWEVFRLWCGFCASVRVSGGWESNAVVVWVLCGCQGDRVTGCQGDRVTR